MATISHAPNPPQRSSKRRSSTKCQKSPNTIQLHPEQQEKALPLFSSKVHAGFLSPTDDHIEEMLRIEHYVVKNPHSTFFVRVQGDSMRDASIHEGDLVVVDRSLSPKHGDIVIVVLHGELAIKRLHIQKNMLSLCAENPSFPPISVREGEEVKVWGVVTYVIHKV